MHLRKLGFTYALCGSFTKHCERIQKYKKTSNLIHLYRNELEKTCFADDAAFSDSKDLGKKTISDQILKNRVYETSRNHKCNGYQRALASLVYEVLTWKNDREQV